MPPRRRVRGGRPPARRPAAQRVVPVKDADAWGRFLGKAKDAVVCLAFTSSWNGPSRQARLYFDNLARQPRFSHVKFACVDLGDAAASALATSLGVAAAPAFQLWHRGALVRNMGHNLEALAAAAAELAGPPPSRLQKAMVPGVAAAAAALIGWLLAKGADAARLARLPPAAADAVRAERAAKRAAKAAARAAARRRVPLPGLRGRAAGATFKGDKAVADAARAAVAAAKEAGVDVETAAELQGVDGAAAPASVDDVAGVLATERARLRLKRVMKEGW